MAEVDWTGRQGKGVMLFGVQTWLTLSGEEARAQCLLRVEIFFFDRQSCIVQSSLELVISLPLSLVLWEWRILFLAIS